MTASPKGRGNRLRLARILFALIPLALAVVVGCKARGPVSPPPEELVAKPWLNLGEALPSHDGDSDTVAGLSQILSGAQPVQIPGRPLHILVMSGGGKYGAFTAGALCGWTATGNRPTFDVATGISSGAVVATLAFLGPKYDQRLTNSFTVLRRTDLFRWRPIRGLCMGTSLMTAEPLEKLLIREINDEFMHDLRTAHLEGRRLYIGTGNILTNRFAVWDLGAIACSDRPDAALLVRKILLASCSVPGVVMPVEFNVEVNGVRYTELHADAGNLAQAFVRTPAGTPTGSTVWCLSAGKVYRDQLKDRPRVMGLIGGAVSNSLYALFRSDLVKLYAHCAISRSQFRLLALPGDFPAETSSFAFNPEELLRMYWVGYQMAAGGEPAWRTLPPDIMPGETSPPRVGFRFVTPP
jgi:hypothetical protein